MGSSLEEIVIIAVASAFFLLMGISVIVLFQVYTKRQLRMLLEKQALESQFQEALLNTRIESQEQTMSHISKELHDNIGQLLSSTKFLIALSQRTLPHPVNSLIEADQALGQAIKELRAVSKSLNKEWLEQFNLLENLTAEVARINASHEHVVTLQHPTEIHLPLERQLILYRVIQEGFQNAIKHGAASHVFIALESVEEQLTVTIQDNGRGFNLAEVSTQSMGIVNMKQRVAILNGTVSWQSGEGGTTVFIKLPLPTSG